MAALLGEAMAKQQLMAKGEGEGRWEGAVAATATTAAAAAAAAAEEGVSADAPANPAGLYRERKLIV